MELADTRLVQGTYTRPTTVYEDLAEVMAEDRYADCALHTLPAAQYATLLATTSHFGSMAIQDDYPGWNENEKHREAAKLLLIDQADHATQHIFFDDNADDEDDCIVDVRDVNTHEVIPWKRFMNRYVVKVEPFRAILEPDYFIKSIEKAEKSRRAEIERSEAGIAEEDDSKEPEPQNEWEALQTASDEEYLSKTVLAVLHEGMKQVEQQRPSAPVEYLAIYLLKNQHKIKLPEKP